MSKPLRFRSRQDLIVALRKCASAEALDYHLSAEERRPLKEVVHGWVSPNTFRAFHHCKRRPSEVFREWGTDTLGEEENLRRLSRVRSQEDYDEWHRNWCDSLLEYWGAEAGKPMPWGPSRKLPNLLMKGLLSDYRDCIWTDDVAGRTAPWLHVPLDSYCLSCIRGELKTHGPGGRIRFMIPRNATMGWVSSQQTYDLINKALRDICREAGVPPIVFDTLAWDSAH